VKKLMLVFPAALFLLMAALGCSEEESDPPVPPPPMPEIADINSSLDPQTPVSTAIEINGSGFLDGPGTVRFQGPASSTDVTPPVGSWSADSIVAMVPAGFTAPVTVTVFVITQNGTSNGIDLDIVSVPDFNPDSLAWATSTAYPEALRGLKAAAVGYTASRAYIYVTGGQTGGGSPANRSDARFIGMTVSGASFNVDAAWTDVNDMPANRAFHALAAASCENSPVPAGTAYLFSVGGQAAATASGGTDSVFSAKATLSTGSLDAWQAAGTIPAPRWGHAALVYRGCLFVVGGYDAAGNPVDTIYQAGVRSDGTLEAFRASQATLPMPAGSIGIAAFGGKMYLFGGETAASANPNAATPGNYVNNAYYAPLTGGEVGPFVVTGSTVLGKLRKKHVMWNSFGQIVAAEGIYDGAIGSTEMTANEINADGTLDAWEGLTGSNVANADVFNAAGATSPITANGSGPRFFLIGGQDWASGQPVAAIWVNTAP